MKFNWTMTFLFVVLLAVVGYALHLDNQDKASAATQVLQRAATETSASNEGYRVEVCAEQTAGATGELTYTWISGRRTIAPITKLHYVGGNKWCDAFFVPLANTPHNVRVGVDPKKSVQTFSYRYRQVTAGRETEWTEKAEVVRFGDGMYPLAISQSQEKE